MKRLEEATEIQEILKSLPKEFEVQVTNGHRYKLRKHHLTGAVVNHYYSGRMVVLGIRADAKDARERFAFMLKSPIWGGKYLSSRVSFKVGG